MGCCGMWGLPEVDEEEPLIIDVHKVLSDKAWNNFAYSFGYFRRKCLKRSDFKIEVPDNYIVFETISQGITDNGHGIKTVATSSDKEKADAAAETSSPKKKSALDGKIPNQRPSNPEAISLDTVFANDTAEKQCYQFKFSKTRTTTVEVSFQKGFTIGGKASFSIGTPKMLGGGDIGLETEMQYNITKSEGQAFEESMNMEATSDINVGAMSTYVAKIQMEERKIHAGFQVCVRMSLPQGKVPIYIRKKKDASLVYVYNVRNVKDAFAGEKMCAKVVEDDKVVGDKIDFIIEGYMKGSLALDHKINLTSDESEQEKEMAKTKRLRDISHDD